MRLHVERHHALFRRGLQVSADQLGRNLAGLEGRGQDVDKRSAGLIRRLALKSP